jgi:hypothetical protein
MTADGDFVASPWLYPGTAAPHSGVLVDGVFTRAALEEFPPLYGRRLVVAVGSNGSPAVVSRKLGGSPVPFVTGMVGGIALGHSAHVSKHGFVPAAPADSADAAPRIVASWLDEVQLAALDATEPNYTRRTVSTADYPLDLDVPQAPEAFDLYESKWGVLREPGADPVALQEQERLFRDVLPRCAPVATLLYGLGTPRETMQALAADEPLRTAVREALHSSGWARPTSFA